MVAAAKAAVGEEQVLVHEDEEDKDMVDSKEMVAFPQRPNPCLFPVLCCVESDLEIDSSVEVTESFPWRWQANFPRIEHRSCPGSAWAVSLHERKNDPYTSAREACRESSERQSASSTACSASIAMGRCRSSSPWKAGAKSLGPWSDVDSA